MSLNQSEGKMSSLSQLEGKMSLLGQSECRMSFLSQSEGSLQIKWTKRPVMGAFAIRGLILDPQVVPAFRKGVTSIPLLRPSTNHIVVFRVFHWRGCGGVSGRAVDPLAEANQDGPNLGHIHILH